MFTTLCPYCWSGGITFISQDDLKEEYQCHAEGCSKRFAINQQGQFWRVEEVEEEVTEEEAQERRKAFRLIDGGATRSRPRWHRHPST